MGEDQHFERFRYQLAERFRWHQFMALLVGLTGLSVIIAPYLVPSQVTVTPLLIVLTVVPGILLIAAAVGIWLRRQWGVWVGYIAWGLTFISGIYQIVLEHNSIFLSSKLWLIIYSVFALALFYVKRNEFK